jgi:hypothetical protein
VPAIWLCLPRQCGDILTSYPIVSKYDFAEATKSGLMYPAGLTIAILLPFDRNGGVFIFFLFFAKMQKTIAHFMSCRNWLLTWSCKFLFWIQWNKNVDIYFEHVFLNRKK